MKNKIIGILGILALMLTPMVTANLIEEYPMGARELCIISSGKWTPDIAGHSIDDGTCNCVSPNRHWDSSKGCRDNAVTQEQQVINTGSSGNDNDGLCDITIDETCSFKLEKYRNSKESYNLKIEGKDYYIEYMGWSFPYWLLKQKVAVIRVTDNKNNRIFWGTIKASSFEFIDKPYTSEHYHFEVIVEDITLNKAYIRVKA